MEAATARKIEGPQLPPDEATEVQQVRDVFRELLKGSKGIALYRHNPARFPDFMRRTFDLLSAFLSEREALSLKVEPETFTVHGAAVLPEDTDIRIAYKFHTEGIRHLIFRRGLTLDELVTFALIAGTNFDDAKHRGQDALSLMWSAAFDHIEYIVVEGFAFGDVSEQEVQVETDKIVAYLYRRLRSTSRDYLRFASVSVEDIDLKLESVAQVRGLVIEGQPVSEKLAQQVQAELRDDEGPRLLPKLTGSIFTLLEEDPDPGSYQEILSQLLDAMLLQEDFGSVNQLLVKLRALERRPGKKEAGARLRVFVLQKMGETERISRIIDILRAAAPKEPQEIQRYLSALDSEAVIPLLEGLDTIEIHENRRLLCDALAVVGGQTPDPFVVRLGSDKSALVRDMIYIIEKLDVPDRARLFEPALKNANLAVRLEAVSLIGKGSSEAARALLVAALKDENSQVRIQAARSLVEFDASRGFQDLARYVKTPEFGRRDEAERQAIYGAMGASQQPAAIVLFNQLLQQKRPRFFARRRVDEEKRLAVAGLAECPTIASYKLLQAETEQRGNDPAYLSEVRKAMAQVRNKLFGDARPPPPGEAQDG